MEQTVSRAQPNAISAHGPSLRAAVRQVAATAAAAAVAADRTDAAAMATAMERSDDTMRYAKSSRLAISARVGVGVGVGVKLGAKQAELRRCRAQASP